MTIAAVVACAAASALAAARWLRVAQREHYIPGSCTRFALRWWWGLGFNRVLLVGVLANLVFATAAPLFAILGAVGVASGPFGLRLKGTAPGPLNATRRLKTLAVTYVAITVLLGAVVALVTGNAALAAFLASVATPALVDLALVVTKPIEHRLAVPWLDRAKARLSAVDPLVVAITGSYGKTSTKGYVRHLVEGSRAVVATPASFNNALGLARSINEHLTPGTEVFVAEMGTYGPGEIAAMCEWAKPSVAAITAIGPVHLERMRTEDVIAQAKSEILETATTVVLNVDDDRLAALADAAATNGKTVVRCSATDPASDVSAIVTDGRLVVRRSGNELAAVPAPQARATNIAMAVALASAVGVPDEAIAKRLSSLPTVANRQALTTGSTGATFIDDTYNSNPAGTAAALEALKRLSDAATRVAVVTPGMVELGDRQAEENEAFAAAASEIATDIVVIGSTNRRALLAGAHRGRARVTEVAGRAEATKWVRENTNEGDVVLFENDLPDHYP